MYTHPSLRVCFAFFLGVLLLASQITATPLDAYAIAPVLEDESKIDQVIRQGFPIAPVLEDESKIDQVIRQGFPIATDAPTRQLDKREGKLMTLYNSVKGADKVKTGATGQWELYPNKGSEAAVYAPSEFYGCTLVVIANGHGVIIGHFAQEKSGAGACTVMNDPKAVQSDIISKLEEAEAQVEVDGHDDTRAWIVYSDDIRTSSPGYTAIMKNLQDLVEVPNNNIVSIPYRRGGGGGNSDKLAVQWAPKADGSGATMNVYIRSDTPRFTGNYDCNGNPVANGKHKRAGPACTPAKKPPSTITNAPSCKKKGHKSCI